jgi:hypothetical protein
MDSIWTLESIKRDGASGKNLEVDDPTHRAKTVAPEIMINFEVIYYGSNHLDLVAAIASCGNRT